jgi:uncharacterized protein YlxW (UPF0749 family)
MTSTHPLSGTKTLVDEDLAPSNTKISRHVCALGLVVDWIVKVVGLVAAVLFGVWAPISYRATMQGNTSNDDSQMKLLEELQKISEVQIRMLQEIRNMKTELQKARISSGKTLELYQEKVCVLGPWLLVLDLRALSGKLIFPRCALNPTLPKYPHSLLIEVLQELLPP